MGLGSIHSARFLEFGFRMLTEGEPQEKLPRLSTPTPVPPDTTASDNVNPTNTSFNSHGGGGLRHYHESGIRDMPAFPERGGPPPLATPGAISDHRLSGDLDMSSESPDGSNLSGSESKYGHSSHRKQREFIPENRKDEQYWEKRRKNNEAARRSREKRRLHDMVLENRIMALEQDNNRLRTELVSLKKRFGVPLDRPFVDTEGGVSQDGMGSMRGSRSPSPPPHTHAAAMKGGNGGCVTAGGRSAYSSPPPLLAVSGGLPVTMQQVAMPGVFPPQPSRLTSFYMGSASHDLHHDRHHDRHHDQHFKHESASAKMMHHQQPGNNKPQTPYDMMVKREPEEESYGARGSAKQEGYSEEGHREEAGGMGPGSRYGHYAPVSPPSVGALSSSAAAHYSTVPGAFPHRPYDHYPRSGWQQRSPMSSHSSDDASDEPLQLTVHKRSSEDESRDADSEQGEHRLERSSGDSNGGGHYSNGPSSPQQASMPVKLRHKMPGEAGPHHAGYPAALSMAAASPYAAPFVNGLTQLSEIALAQASPLSLVKKDRGSSGSSGRPLDLKHLDPKYLERRRRNNEAARKCRENRKNLTRLREAKSDYLESENNKLRQELDGLQEEMKQLRELLDKKRLEQGLSLDAAQEQAFTDEQMKRLAQLEHEHHMLELEQERLQRRQQLREERGHDTDDMDEDSKDMLD